MSNLIASRYPDPELDYSVLGNLGIFNNVWNHFVVKQAHPGVRQGTTNNGSTRYVPYYASKGSKTSDPISLFDIEGVLSGRFGSIKFIHDESPNLARAALGVFCPTTVEGWEFLAEIQTQHDSLAIKYGPSPQFTKEYARALQKLALNYKLPYPPTPKELIE